jgi:hypothetical protein
MGGNMLLNSGTPTVRIVISYGGTTMISDISGTATADTDRLSWWIDFEINAQANNDQALVGSALISSVGTKTAPTTGIGDIWSTTGNSNSFAGSAAVDSDAANQTLAVTVQFDVSNSANQLVTESAILEII